MNRRLVKSWERQRSLRNSTQQKLFTSPPQRDGFLSPLPSNQPAAGIFLDMQSTHVYPPTSRHAEHSCCNTLLDRSTPIEPIYTIHQSTEEEPERPLLAAEAINMITVDQMLSGTSVMSFTSSPDVFAGTMSLASVPQEVSEHMKNRANSVAGFLSRVKVLNPDIACRQLARVTSYESKSSRFSQRSILSIACSRSQRLPHKSYCSCCTKRTS